MQRSAPTRLASARVATSRGAKRGRQPSWRRCLPLRGCGHHCRRRSRSLGPHRRRRRHRRRRHPRRRRMASLRRRRRHHRRSRKLPSLRKQGAPRPSNNRLRLRRRLMRRQRNRRPKAARAGGRRSHGGSGAGAPPQIARRHLPTRRRPPQWPSSAAYRTASRFARIRRPQRPLLLRSWARSSATRRQAVERRSAWRARRGRRRAVAVPRLEDPPATAHAPIAPRHLLVPR